MGLSILIFIVGLFTYGVLTKKKTVIISGLFLLLLYIYFPPLKLVKTGDRNYREYPLSKELKGKIYKDVKELPYGLGLIDYCFSLTADLLEFSEQNDIENGTANCIGYARLCTSICNYALEVDSCEGRVKHVVGYITWCGINLCNVAQSVVPSKYKSFVRDHDFIELDYEDEYVYIDPSLYDLMGNKCQTIVKK